LRRNDLGAGRDKIERLLRPTQLSGKKIWDELARGGKQKHDWGNKPLSEWVFRSVQKGYQWKLNNNQAEKGTVLIENVRPRVGTSTNFSSATSGGRENWRGRLKKLNLGELTYQHSLFWRIYKEDKNRSPLGSFYKLSRVDTKIGNSGTAKRRKTDVLESWGDDEPGGRAQREGKSGRKKGNSERPD